MPWTENKEKDDAVEALKNSEVYATANKEHTEIYLYTDGGLVILKSETPIEISFAEEL